MEMLRTKSPEMVRKEVLMHMIAYNAIRLLMLKAGKACGVSHRRISFKGVIQVMEESRLGFEKATGKPRQEAKEKGSADTQAWVANQLDKLVHAPYFMVTFTLPSELRKVMRRHAEVLYNKFFAVSSRCLRDQLASKEDGLGAVG